MMESRNTCPVIYGNVHDDIHDITQILNSMYHKLVNIS